MKRFLLLAAALFSWLVVTPAVADLRLPAIFSDHMILQRGRPAPVWGWADPGERITVRFAGQSHSTAAGPDGKWILRLDSLEASAEPREFSVDAGAGEHLDTIRLQNVIVGEVWLCSGQSNMEMPMKGYNNEPILRSNDAIARSSNSAIRLFTVQRKTSGKPLDDVAGRWEPSSPEVVSDFSAVGYSFAEYVHRVLGVPVGAIDSSWGGTPVQAWTERSTLGAIPGVDVDRDVGDRAHHVSAALYNGMIHPLVPYGLRGALWYQGESNVSEPALYEKMFVGMIGNWRGRWGQGEFPFYFVQISPYDYGERESAYLREAQLKTMLSVRNTGMAVTLDIGEKRNIHPAEKIEVGRRLAFWALAKTYGIDAVVYSGPVYRSMRVKKGEAILEFDFADNGLNSYGVALNGFTIAGSDKVFHPAEAQITRPGVLRVSSDAVKQPVAVRYAWENWLVGSLFNTAGLPASSFRTDDW